jgi:hypothetical protein
MKGLVFITLVGFLNASPDYGTSLDWHKVKNDLMKEKLLDCINDNNIKSDRDILKYCESSYKMYNLTKKNLQDIKTK